MRCCSPICSASIRNISNMNPASPCSAGLIVTSTIDLASLDMRRAALQRSAAATSDDGSIRLCQSVGSVVSSRRVFPEVGPDARACSVQPLRRGEHGKGEVGVPLFVAGRYQAPGGQGTPDRAFRQPRDAAALQCEGFKRLGEGVHVADFEGRHLAFERVVDHRPQERSLGIGQMRDPGATAGPAMPRPGRRSRPG